MNRFTLTFAAALSALTLGAALPSAAQDNAATETAPAAETEAAPAAQVLPDMVMGAEDAPVTLIEYASYTCGHCANWEKDIFPRLKLEYIDTGKVRFIHREVYFDKIGLWAGMVARCGGDEKYFPIMRMIYDEQSDWIGSGKPAEIGDNLRKIGLKAGLDAEQIDACFADQALAESMVMTFQETAGKDGINATPTLMINGETFQNAPWEELKAKLDEMLEEAAQ